MRVLAQRLLAFGAVLVALVQLAQQRRTLATVLAERGGLLPLLFAHLLQLLAACNDLLLGVVERLQVGRQCGDGLGALTLHVSVIRQLAVGIGDLVL
ncbi:hypothetical protein D3C81_1474590 [compost metagenome]